MTPTVHNDDVAPPRHTDPMNDEHTDCEHAQALAELRTLMAGIRDGITAALTATATNPTSPPTPASEQT